MHQYIACKCIFLLPADALVHVLFYTSATFGCMKMQSRVQAVHSRQLKHVAGELLSALTVLQIL
jgi:hypothetical protein